MKTSGTNLNACVTSAVNGDQSSWSVLYRQLYPGMYALALRLCENTGLAADAVQDAFVKCYLHLFQLKDPNKFGGWLKQILIYTCYRSLSIHRKQVLLNNLFLHNENLWEDELSDRLHESAVRTKLYAGLAALPEVLRSTILLRFFSAFQTYETIGSILHIPVGTVKSRLNDAKKKLAEYWHQHHEVNSLTLHESEEWNSFYYSMYGGIHNDECCKNKFIGHLRKESVVFSGGKEHAGYKLFEELVQSDLKAGSWLQPVNVSTSGNISIVDSVHFNSLEHPHHCPESSVLVICRRQGKASELYLYASEK